MAQSIKLKNETYIDSTGVVHNRQLLSNILNPTILYENASGSNGNITLKDSIDNYAYIEIFFHADSDNAQNSVKVLSPYNRNIALSSFLINLSGNYEGVFMRFSIIKIENQIITILKNGQLFGGGSATESGTTNNHIYIDTVIGYKQ